MVDARKLARQREGLQDTPDFSRSKLKWTPAGLVIDGTAATSTLVAGLAARCQTLLARRGLKKLPLKNQETR